MDLQHIPEELKQLNHWCIYRKVWNEERKKYTKIPINPYTGYKGKSNDESTWSDFQTALTALTTYQGDGLGIYFKPPYVGVDIDNIEGEIARYHQGDIETNIMYEFVHSLKSYAEYSPSGTGIHIILKGKIPGNRRRKGDIEMYSNGRFFTVTGNIVNKNYSEIKQPDPTTFELLYKRYIGEDNVVQFKNNEESPKGIDLSEEEIIQKALESRQGKKFEVFLKGGWEAFYDSQSEADIAFANMLAFWTGRDFEKMDSIFRSSNLMREKYDQRRPPDSTYGNNLLNKAIQECKKTYSLNPANGFHIYIKDMKEEKETKKNYSYDDTGNADRFVDIFGTMVRYSYINKEFFYYDGKVWQPDNTGEVFKMIDQSIEIMKKEPIQYPEGTTDDEKEELIKAKNKHIKKSRGNAAKKALKEQLMHRLSILPEEFDQSITSFNTQNGYLDLITGQLYEHDVNKFFSRISNVEFTDTIDAPMWEKFLNQTFGGNKDLIRYVQKAIGYSMSGSTKEQSMFVLFGAGSNGKTVLLDTIIYILGNYATNMQAETIMIKQSSSSANTDIARLKGARFVTSSEPNEGVRLDEGLVKQLTGGDKVTARFLYGKEFEFEPEFKLWLATNHKPIIRGTDDGIWRRINLIPFTEQVAEKDKDKDLKNKLKSEAVGILNWMVEGWLMYQKEGLKRPQVVEDASREYREEMDVTSAFVNECCEVQIGQKVKAKDLYQVYREWAGENGQFQMNSTRFGKEMGNKFNKRKSDGVIVYEGIRLNEENKPYINEGIKNLF